MSINNENTKLLLGDIIKIYAPTNSNIHEQEYLIEYIDKKKMKLLNENGQEILTLDERGYINDQSVLRIDILYRNNDIGYVKQNELIVDSWINIYFGGDVPRIIVGLIVDVEEDMIKVKTYPEDDYIYIDFGYQGIPEEYNIEKIEIRDSPATKEKLLEKETQLLTREDIFKEENLEMINESTINKESKKQDNLEEGEIEEEKPESNDMQDFDENINMIENELKEVETYKIGTNLGKITQFERLSEDKKKYGIDVQVNDLVDNIINKIPFKKRNTQSFKKVNTIVDRFIILRNDFSIKDEYYNPINLNKKDENFKPVLNKLLNGNNNFSWLIPVTKMSKKIYDSKQDEAISEDVFSISFTDVRSEEHNLYENYNSSSGDNRYKYYIRKYDNYTIPFKQPINNEGTHILTVNTPINTIVKNFGDFESTIYSELDKYQTKGLNSKKYFNQVYIDGLKYPSLNDKKLNEYNSKLYNLTNNDEMYILSYTMFPLVFAEINRPKLKSTSIYNKCKNDVISYSSLNDFFNNMKVIQQDATDNQINFDNKNIIEYTWNNVDESSDNFNKYLQSILPDTNEIYKNLKITESTISISKILNILHPYGISTDDLYINNYKFLKESIRKEQDLYFDNFKKKRTYYNKYNKSLKLSSFDKNNSVLFLTPNMDYKKMEEIKSLYLNVKNSEDMTSSFKKLSNSELITLMNQLDNSSYLQLMMKKEIIKLKNPEYKDIIESQIKNEVDKKVEEEECNPIVISKKYYNKKDLENDNNKEIFFDKKLDDTQYDIIKAYQKEKDTMKDEEFLSYFIKKLQDVNGLSPSRSEEYAKIMIAGKKKVKENDYAVLYNYVDDEIENKMDNIEYYKRENKNENKNENGNENKNENENKNKNENKNENENENRNGEKWIFDEEMTKQKGYKFEKLIENACDSSINCFDEESIIDLSCVSKNTKVNIINEKLLKEMEIEYFKKYYKQIDDFEEYEKKYNDFIEKLIVFKKKNIESYNKKYVNISNDFEEVPVVISPHKKKLDQIFLIEDLNERYEFLLLFKNKYTRSAYNNEDKYYYYCIDSNVELLPTFFSLLAEAYINKNNYKKILYELCDKQGRNEDNKVIDEYSGYVIRDRDFDESEGYDEQGFKVVTNDVIVDENEDFDIETNNQEIDFIIDEIINIKNKDENVGKESDIQIEQESKEITFIKSTTSILEKVLKIELGNLKQFILQKVNIIVEKKIQKTDKELEGSFNFTLFLLTVSMFLISLQLLYPNLNLKRTSPGCTISLVGYPLFDLNDNSSIQFISCVIKSHEKKMNYNIEKLKTAFIADNIRKIIEKYIIPEIKEVIQRKRNSLKKIKISENEIKNTNEYSLFHPPLTEFKMKTQVNISQQIKDNINDNNISILDTLTIIKSKNMILSYDLIFHINEIIRKENPLLKNVYDEPYLENACCVDDNINNSFSYFQVKNNHIYNLHNYVNSNNKVILAIENYVKAKLLSIDINTKFVYPTISDTLEEVTINNLLRKNSLIESISQLSNLYKNKLINYTFNDNIVNKIELFRGELQDIKTLYSNEKNNDFSMKDLKNKLYRLIDVYNIKIKEEDKKNIKKEILSIREYLNNYILDYKKRIIDVLSLKKSEDDKNKLFEYIDVCLKFDENKSNMFNYINYMINIVEETGVIFPSMIINNISFKDKRIPGHWNLNKLHVLQIKKNIDNYYYHIHTYIGNETIKQEFESIVQESLELLQFLRKIPYFDSKNSLFDIKLIQDIFYFSIIYVFYLYLKNNKSSNKKFVKDILLSYLEILNNSYEESYIDKRKIMKRVLRDKEKEKDKITKKFKYELNEEEKEIALLFRKNKLGEYGIGLRKEYVVYNKNMDEKNRKQKEEDLENNYIGNINEDGDQEII
tara:strand:+ start:6447 stop:12077 length:5631 start_codon:yes stop_codon:yes gene_type:complete